MLGAFSGSLVTGYRRNIDEANIFGYSVRAPIDYSGNSPTLFRRHSES